MGRGRARGEGEKSKEKAGKGIREGGRGGGERVCAILIGSASPEKGALVRCTRVYRYCRLYRFVWMVRLHVYIEVFIPPFPGVSMCLAYVSICWRQVFCAACSIPSPLRCSQHLFCQHLLSTPFDNTLTTPLVNTFCQHLLSIPLSNTLTTPFVNTVCQHPLTTLLQHLLTTPFDNTLSTPFVKHR